MVFIHVYHSKAWLVDDYRDPALQTNITTTVTGAVTRDSLFEPDPKNSNQALMYITQHCEKYNKCCKGWAEMCNGWVGVSLVIKRCG